jgi:hypothetical protein
MDEFSAFNMLDFASAQRFFNRPRFIFALRRNGFEAAVSGHLHSANDALAAVHSFFGIFVAKLHFNILVF